MRGVIEKLNIQYKTALRVVLVVEAQPEKKRPSLVRLVTFLDSKL